MVKKKTKLLSTIDKKQIEELKNNSIICYGHFNIVHPGHLRFLEFAKKQGDQLIVALLADKDLPKGLYFSQEERSLGLFNTDLVDHIIILDSGDLSNLTKLITPESLVFGKDMQKKYPPAIAEAIKVLDINGGRVIFHSGDIRYSNSRILADTPALIEEEKKNTFIKSCQNQKILKANLLKHIENFSNKKILVIGDSIVDQYVACDALGMSAEAPVLVVKELGSKNYLGGAAIVASHVKALGGDCEFISISGDDKLGIFLRNNLDNLGINNKIIIDPSRPTTHKIRYMVDQQKLFRVSRLSDSFLDDELEDSIILSIQESCQYVDAIIVSDFVYGLITPKILDAIKELAKNKKLYSVGDVQCSTQVGSASKFEDFSIISATEREVRMSLNNQEGGLEEIANQLMEVTQCNSMLLKLGSEGFISYEVQDRVDEPLREQFPALVASPLDLTGAGDSLLAAITLATSVGASLMESSAIGASVAGLAVKKMGNIPVNKDELLNYINSEIQW